ncbi:IclR family transcriptional regulator [Streptomyces sp. NRRL WC-3618]|uniref:IclR family transcriptional regulator n=1 Tax=Streptomyces sp. NRRL WC-3618 TaxID=1519490 RepID=UPI00099C1385|nr:helix-turn-helix domain-containing protein [Streptomyces sp. NRRL WC-3618]
MTVQSVQRAARILHELATAGPRLGVTDLADRIGVSRPTAHALLRTLEAEGLVRQEKETSKYLLGPALLRLGNSFLETQELRSRSVAWADTLAERIGEAVWVAVLDGRLRTGSGTPSPYARWRRSSPGSSGPAGRGLAHLGLNAG